MLPYTPVDIAIAVVALVFIPVTSGWTGKALARATGERRPLIGSYVRTIARGLAMIALIAGVWVWFGRSFSSLGFDWPIGVRGLTGFGIDGVILLYYSYALLLKKRSAAELKAMGERLGRMGADRVLPATRAEHLLFPVVAVVGSCFEEVVYRGFLFWFITPVAGLIGAVVVSSAVFGLGHAYLGRASIIRTGAIGAAFGIAYAATGSLWWLMVAHVTVNLFAVPMHRRLRRDMAGLAVAVIALCMSACTTAKPLRAAPDPLPETGTFSIIAYDSSTGEWGGAVQSRVFSVGNGVLWAEAGVGVVATQAVVDVSYGPQALALLREGKSASDVVKYVWDHDPNPDSARWAKTGRQFAVVDAKGNVAAYTGPTAPAEFGDKQGVHVTAQGNTLASKAVPDSMVAAFNRTKGHLAFRLLAGIEAGQAAGGDRRGMQSAAMIIVKKCGGVWLHNDVVLRLQVDDSAMPIAELRRLVEKAPLPPRGVTNARNDPACR